MPVSAFGESWDNTEKALFATVLYISYLDYNQTIEIAKSDGYYWEINPLMGRNPSIGRVNNYFLASTIGKYIIADKLESNRKLFLYGLILIESAFVTHNVSIGLKF